MESKSKTLKMLIVTASVATGISLVDNIFAEAQSTVYGKAEMTNCVNSAKIVVSHGAYCKFGAGSCIANACPTGTTPE